MLNPLAVSWEFPMAGLFFQHINEFEVTAMNIDLKKEQQASLDREHYPYSLAARFFFATMDLLAGKKDTLAKAKLIEILATIPYRSWENQHYGKLTRNYDNPELVKKSDEIMRWGREAQDNEYLHLLVINEKMKEDQMDDPWYFYPIIPFFMVLSYVIMTRVLAFLSPRRAFLFNAEFEDHAEHVYAQLVKDHPEWEDQPVRNSTVDEYGNFDSWADVFRRIGLDERDHRNHSFVLCGMADRVADYKGMPAGAPEKVWEVA